MSICAKTLAIAPWERTRGRTLVTTQTTGTERARATERCSAHAHPSQRRNRASRRKSVPFDIPMRPAFAPTMSKTKSGDVAVSPNNVVLRYFSCPARSAKLTTLEALAEISSQLSCCLRGTDPCGGTSAPSSFSVRTACTPSGRTSRPLGVKPMSSMPTEEVRPVSISCLWRKRLTRARPRPSSRRPLVRTAAGRNASTSHDPRF